MNHSLSIQDYEVQVSLGCSADEQAEKQPVHFNLQVNFSEKVPGSVSDNIEDALDYVVLTNIIKTIAQKKKYHLVEHLNQQVFDALVSYLQSQNINAEIQFSVKKIKVPIENLRNGVVFTCTAKL